MICTWKNCNREAVAKQYDREGKVWSNLCKEHAQDLQDSIDSLDSAYILKVWVLASGGADKLAERTTFTMKDLKIKGSNNASKL